MNKRMYIKMQVFTLKLLSCLAAYDCRPGKCCLVDLSSCMVGDSMSETNA